MSECSCSPVYFACRICMPFRSSDASLHQSCAISRSQPLLMPAQLRTLPLNTVPLSYRTIQLTSSAIPVIIIQIFVSARSYTVRRMPYQKHVEKASPQVQTQPSRFIIRKNLSKRNSLVIYIVPHVCTPLRDVDAAIARSRAIFSSQPLLVPAQPRASSLSSLYHWYSFCFHSIFVSF